MFTKRELKAIAISYVVVIPLGVAAIVLLDGAAGLIAAACLFSLGFGFCVTMLRL